MSAHTEQKSPGWLELVGIVYGLALMAPWAQRPMDIQQSIEIDIALMLAPVVAFVAWFIWLGVSLRAKALNAASAAAKAPKIRLSPADLEYMDANAKRNAEIGAETWDSVKERAFNTKFAALIEEDTYMHASFDRRERLENCTWSKEEEVAFNRRFPANV